MLSNHKLQVILEEIKEISRVDLSLYSDKGKLLTSTCEIEDNMEGAIQLFAESMAESQMLSGCHFFKVLVEHELEYILLARASGEEAYMIGRLAVCQIRNMVGAYQEQFDRNSFIQNIVLGNMLVVDMYNKAKKLHIEAAQRVVFVIEVSGKKDGVVVEGVSGIGKDAGGQSSDGGDGQSPGGVWQLRGAFAGHCPLLPRSKDGLGGREYLLCGQ